MEKTIRVTMFGCFLLAAAVQDLREKTISGRLLAAGMLCGIPWALRAFGAQGPGGILPGFLPGLFLLGVSFISEKAVGYGDGMFFAAAALYLPPAAVFALFCGGTAACGLFCACLLVRSRFRNQSLKNCRVPFLPFLVPAGGILLLLG